MLLIVEIVFAVIAWRRGWGARVLLPFGAGLGFMLAAGVFAAVAGVQDPAPLRILGFISDLVLTGVLGYMARVPRQAPVAIMAVGDAADEERQQISPRAA